MGARIDGFPVTGRASEVRGAEQTAALAEHWLRDPTRTIPVVIFTAYGGPPRTTPSSVPSSTSSHPTPPASPGDRDRRIAELEAEIIHIRLHGIRAMRRYEATAARVSPNNTHELARVGVS
jgi:hypothetical protein